jgi:hypothetical protein
VWKEVGKKKEKAPHSLTHGTKKKMPITIVSLELGVKKDKTPLLQEGTFPRRLSLTFLGMQEKGLGESFLVKLVVLLCSLCTLTIVSSYSPFLSLNSQSELIFYLFIS